jgi:hypothetical protein
MLYILLMVGIPSAVPVACIHYVVYMNHGGHPSACFSRMHSLSCIYYSWWAPLCMCQSHALGTFYIIIIVSTPSCVPVACTRCVVNIIIIGTPLLFSVACTRCVVYNNHHGHPSAFSSCVHLLCCTVYDIHGGHPSVCSCRMHSLCCV